MGFKNAGFPHYSFNPMGFRTRGGFQQKLQDECGLLLGSTDLEIDRVGKSSRDAVQGVEIIGDGSTYIKNILLANLALTYVDATTLLPVVSAWDANGEFIIPVNGVAGLTTVYLTKTYTLNTIPDENEVYQLVPDDNSEPILAQQFLAPATPTQINTDVISMADSYGYTIADGTQYYDEAGTLLIPVGTIIPNYPNGVASTAYVGGVHPTGTYYGRVKFDAELFEVQNVVENNDFSDGTSSLIGSSATLSATDNVLSVTGTGATNTAQVYQGGENVTAGEKWFIFSKSRITNSLCNSLNLQWRDAASVVAKTINNPVENQWYELYDIVTILNDSSDGRLFFLVSIYPDAATANGKVMEVDGRISEGGGVFAVKLEGNIADITEDQALYMVHLMQAGTDVQNGYIISDKYNQLISADDTEILYSSLAEPNPLIISSMSNITEDKFFFDATTEKTLFFEEPLTGDCKVKANSWMGFNEIFMVSDGEGGYIPYVVDGDTMYVLKEGVTRV